MKFIVLFVSHRYFVESYHKNLHNMWKNIFFRVLLVISHWTVQIREYYIIVY